MKRSNSNKLNQRALQIIPGGVNSPVRSCSAVGSSPLFIQEALGSHITDADGNTYIDYVGSWGPMILGHRHPAVLEAIEAVLKRGLSFGAPIDLEIELAEIVIKAVPSIEMVRMVNSGTEATMSAIRLARGITGRSKIIKFDGCYHGHADTLLVKAGSGVATLGIPGSPGVPLEFVEQTLSLQYNNTEMVTEVMQAQGSQIACIIVEPVAGNMGMVKPRPEFLKALRDLTLKCGSLLIFDEVMTGFRVAYGGAQELYNIMPDITCLGKIIGGGLPVGAYGGPIDIMRHVAPQGPVYQAGTLSGNPVAMSAGIATLRQLSQPDFYRKLTQKTETLIKNLKNAAEKHGIPVFGDFEGGMAGLFFQADKVIHFDDAKKSDLNRFAEYFRGMLDHGIYLAPSQFEAFFLSAAHSDEDIQKTIDAANHVLGDIK